jgi:PadR family transcriptional regulator, regulatory protein PadR
MYCIYQSKFYGEIVPRSQKPQELVLGTLDMLTLRTRIMGPAHGHTTAHVIKQTCDDALQVEPGSLYPALHGLEDHGWGSSFWGAGENHRQARFYRLSAAGRRQFTAETHRSRTMVEAIGRILATQAKSSIDARKACQ